MFFVLLVATAFSHEYSYASMGPYIDDVPRTAYVDPYTPWPDAQLVETSDLLTSTDIIDLHVAPAVAPAVTLAVETVARRPVEAEIATAAAARSLQHR